MKQEWRTEAHPYLVLTTETQVKWPVCIECDFAAYDSRRAVSAEIATTPHDKMLLHYAPLRRQAFNPDWHVGHRVIELTGTLIVGSRLAPDIAARLRELDPNLCAQVARYQGDRRPPSVEIHQALVSLGSDDLFDPDFSLHVDRQRWLGHRTLSQRSEGELLGLSLTQEPEVTYRHKEANKPVHTHVTISSGINVVESLLVNGRAMVEHLQQELRTGRDEESLAVAGQFAWILFGLYMDLMAHLPEYQPFVTRKIRPEEHGSLASLIASLPIAGATRCQLTGDLAILQWEIQGKTSLLPDIRTAEQLRDRLVQLPYERFSGVKGKEPRAFVAKAVKGMAQQLERVVIATVDWTSVMDSLHFPHKK